ncbi:MAG TPA: hypothetical protein VF486_25155 [Actinomycetes bacterium]
MPIWTRANPGWGGSGRYPGKHPGPRTVGRNLMEDLVVVAVVLALAAVAFAWLAFVERA